MERSVNQIINEFQLVADAHDQINTFFWGSFLEAIKNEPTYPLLCCTLVPVELTQHDTLMEIQVVVADRVFHDRTNANDIQSDTLQILKDVHSIIHLSRWQSIATPEVIQRADYFEGAGGDYLGGWSMLLRLKVVDERNYANMPLTNYNPLTRYE